MGPQVRRSWQPRGQTPVLLQRGRRLEKVVAVAALCVSPRRGRARLYFRLHSNAEIAARQVIAFLRRLDRELKGSCVLLWDNLNAHRAKRTRRFVEMSGLFHPCFPACLRTQTQPGRIRLELLENEPPRIHFKTLDKGLNFE
jgi:DDE superfamily endonuclease